VNIGNDGDAHGSSKVIGRVTLKSPNHLAVTIDFFEQLERHAAARPGDIALGTISETSTDSLTYSELIGQSRALSQVLRDAGAQPGSRIALLMPNDHHFGVAFLAAANAGAVIVPLDSSQDVPRLCAVIAHAECWLLICSDDGSFAGQGRAIEERLPEVVVLNPRALSPLDVEIKPPWPLGSRDPDSDFLLLYTGGTTGAPKGVRLSLRNIFITIRDTLDVFPLTPGDHILSILPLFHIMAIQANLLAPLYTGARVTYLQSRDPQRIVAAFGQQGITAFLCVPLFYYQLHRRIFGEVARQSPAKRTVFHVLRGLSRFLRTTLGWNAGRLLFRPVHQRFGKRLRGFGVGAARFAPEIAADLHDLGFPFFQGYGMTETSGLAAISPMSIGGGLSSGRALRNVEIRIEAPDPQGQGEILLRGGNIMQGYWKDAEATDATLAEGWLRTGDVGQISNGDLHIIGRKKEVIVLSSGKNIFPEPLETWFQANCPLIQEMCIFGLSDHRNGAERLHALLVPDAPRLRELGIANIREELRYRIENLNRNLPPHEKLNGFDVRLEPLPRTSSRKLQRFRIQEEFARAGKIDVAQETTPAPCADEPENLAVIREMIARIKPGRGIHPGMNLELDLSFDSLERVELLSNVQEAFGLRIPAEQAASILTVSDVMALARDHAPLATDWAEWSDILRQPLSETEQALADRFLSARPLAAPLFFIATKAFCLIAKVLLRYRFRAAQQWAGQGPLILCGNHQSYLDFPLIVGALPYPVFRRVFSLSTSRLVRSRFQSWFGRAARAVPIDADRNLRTALRLAAEGLRRGMVLCVFPEGHRSIDGALQPFRKGVAIVAVESGADTIPIGITGTGSVWGRASKRIRLASVRVECGAPIHPSPEDDYESFNRRLMGAVQELIRSQ
jgi:long-chain acyl-CoA synthetase